MSKRAALYQQFNPARPLEAGEENLYVDWQRMLGLDDVKTRLAQSIALSGSTPVCRLFTGHRGVGKTTELKRVKRLLESGDAGAKLFVCFLEAERWMHPEDITSTDIVFHVARQIVDDLKQAGFDFGMTKLTEFFREFGELLSSEVELKGIKIPVGPVELGVELKDNPVTRPILRRLLAGHQPRIFDLINQVILKDAREWLRKPAHGGYEDVLVIVDQLDRIPQKILNDRGLTNHENLFLDHAGELKFLNCDVLCTVPIELAYSRCRERLKTAYAAEVLSLPVIPVVDRTGGTRGLDALREIVRRRAAAEGMTREEAFQDDDTLNRLCRMSGGHVRNLFILLRSAIERCPDLPITRDAVERTVRQQASDILLPIRKKEWQALQWVHEYRKPYDADADLWYGLLRDQMAFTYADQSGVWYDWNPLFGEVPAGAAP